MSSESIERFKLPRGIAKAFSKLRGNLHVDDSFIADFELTVKAALIDHERIVKELEARVDNANIRNAEDQDHDSEQRAILAKELAALRAQPSLSDAIKEVEKMRDGYEQERKRRVELYLDGDLYQDGRVRAAEDIVALLKSLSPQKED